MAEAVVSKAKVIHSLQSYRDQARELLDRADAIVQLAEEQERLMTPEEVQEFDRLNADAEGLYAQFEAESHQAEVQAAKQKVQAARQKFIDHVSPQDMLTRGAVRSVAYMREGWTRDPQWGFRGHGDFAMAVYQTAMGGARDERLDRILGLQAALDHNVPQSGGFLLPPLHNTTIYNHMMGARTNLMALCDLYPLSGNLYIELLANAETSRVSGSRWGGIQSYWVEDGSTVTDSQPKVRNMELRPRQLATLVKVTNTLLQNAMALEAFLDQAAVDDQIQVINNAIMRGDGTAKPKGFLTSGSLVTITKETSQAAATIVDDNIHKMWARCLEEDQAVWLINRDALPQVEGLAAGGVSGTIPVMLANVGGYPTMAVQGPQMLKGRPIRRVEQCSTVGTIGDFILANMSGYALAYRARGDAGTADGEPAIQKDMSMHLEFDKNRTAFRYIIAVDGQTWLASAITPEQGTSTLSHFVVIGTRS